MVVSKKIVRLLVVSTILKKYEFVNGVGMTSLFYEMENNPVVFETTNQL